MAVCGRRQGVRVIRIRAHTRLGRQQPTPLHKYTHTHTHAHARTQRASRARRALAARGAGPPLGASPSAARLYSFFFRFCSPHPRTWGALLQGLLATGDPGSRVLRSLRGALAQPHAYMAMAGLRSDALDRARSRVLAAMLRGVLAAPEGSSRLSAVSAAAAQQLAAAAAAGGGGGAGAAASAGGCGAAAPGYAADPCVAQLLRTLDVPANVQLQQQLAHPGSSASRAGTAGAGLRRPSVPGVPLLQQPAQTRLKVLLLLQLLEVCRAWGVAMRHDAALAAALQVLRLCWDTEDARQSGGCCAAGCVCVGGGGRCQFGALSSPPKPLPPPPKKTHTHTTTTTTTTTTITHTHLHTLGVRHATAVLWKPSTRHLTCALCVAAAAAMPSRYASPPQKKNTHARARAHTHTHTHTHTTHTHTHTHTHTRARARAHAQACSLRCCALRSTWASSPQPPA
jgi:hypothetical protein